MAKPSVALSISALPASWAQALSNIAETQTAKRRTWKSFADISSRLVDEIEFTHENSRKLPKLQ
jgi:hypothetical protein